ncbi:hypothetical protein IVB14_07100 [Bradyrhizobium sp. 180]|uniref:hypothetical protein n=1 Tax=unclassified Bradyrhizobium TaxID=2631580 RepID=UPI001FFAF561|nr:MULTISPECIES: hypothetical protein [unclassified Bradyrhizobium]MCK1422211.1 hypothetical protein [Bradyrhizobium sp. CW12]MCK1490197.1 hypothetical protein [Bradyrhizobium sp. 180]MCK1644062.1 hypothetical protein [Bradyrhizobium sp. 154]MCK1663559.1 hypothetical protein [Bradyrhizobium sp. 153]
MRKLIRYAPEKEQNDLLKDANACAASRDSAESHILLAQPPARQVFPHGRAVVLIAVSVLAATSGAETRASSESPQVQGPASAGSRSSNVGNASTRLMQAAANNPISRQAPEEHHGAELLPPELVTAKDSYLSSRASSEKVMHISQAAVGDIGQSPERRSAERRSCELTVGTRALGLLQPLEPKHQRADSLDQEFTGNLRESEAQTALAAKREESAAPPHVTDSGAAELRKLLQQERERASQLEQDLASAKRDVETQAALATKANEETSRLRHAAESDATQVKRSLQQEHDKAEALAKELSTARTRTYAYEAQARKTDEQLQDLKKRVSDSGAAGLRASLQQERERASRLEQDLASAKLALETQTALVTKAQDETSRLKHAESDAAQLKQSLQQEHDKAEALAKELSTARTQTYAYEAQARKTDEQLEDLKKRAADNGAAELRTSLQQERERASWLEQELTSAKRDVETQTALVTKAQDETSRLKHAESDAAQLKQSLQQEHDKAEALAKELSTARTQTYAYEAQARKIDEQLEDLKKRAADNGAAELRASLQQERERASRLEQELASAKRDVETQTALLTKAQDETSRLKQAAESDATQLKRSLQQEHDKAEALAKEFQAAHAARDEYDSRARNESGQVEQLKKVAETETTEPHKSLQQEQASVKQVDPASERRNNHALTAAVVASARPIPSASNELEADRAKPLEADQIKSARVGNERPHSADEGAAAGRLVARARMLLEQGDIGAARIVLERAAEIGNAQAAFALAETYDPHVLPKWSTVGTLGDVSKARELYARAEAVGNTQAKQRLEALR